MRPGQQNRRSRNRNNNSNRKGPNPLSRSYESNGPDVKIRGNAQHVADKYSQLARDASASGDRVMAENYLQHAEHYYRIIAAAQAQLGIQQQRERDDDDADEGDDIDAAASANGQDSGDFTQGSGPQPVFSDTPAEVAIEETEVQGSTGGENRGDGDRRNRRNRNRRPMQAGDGGEGGEGEQRQFQPRNRQDRGERPDRQDRGERQDRAPRAEVTGGEEDGPQDGSAIGWLAVAGQD